MLEYVDVSPRLDALGVGGGAEFWSAVRGNLTVLDDAKRWWDIVHGTIDPVIEDAAFLVNAAELLPSEPWDTATWGAWTNAVKSATGAKGKNGLKGA